MLSLLLVEADQGSLDLNVAEEILDRDHYGLEQVKERILEFLAVRQLTKNSKGPILCLVGPPGGRQDIPSPICGQCLKPQFCLSFLGVRDEAEIRGHRRTYIDPCLGA